MLKPTTIMLGVQLFKAAQKEITESETFKGLARRVNDHLSATNQPEEVSSQKSVQKEPVAPIVDIVPQQMPGFDKASGIVEINMHDFVCDLGFDGSLRLFRDDDQFAAKPVFIIHNPGQIRMMMGGVKK